MSNTPLKFALITGANSGIGLHLAKSLFASGNFSSIVLACRDEKKANLAIEEIKKSVKDVKELTTNLNYLQLDLSSKTSVEQFVKNFCQVCPRNCLNLLVNNAGIMGHPYQLDLSSKTSVEQFVKNFCQVCPRNCLNLLVNNAGIMGHPYQLSPDGVELHYATNHLGHFLLTNLLLKNQMFERFARILILTSSLFERFSVLLNVEELQSPTPLYSPNDYYSVSKYANFLHAVGLAKQFKEDSVEIKVVSISPGFVRGTQLGRQTNYFLRTLATPLIWFFSKNLDQGISTLLHCINSPYSELESGKLYKNCMVKELPGLEFTMHELVSNELFDMAEK
uniref:Uncharacterized protein n=1 Tax=Meloidogyne incognita TaxID=6306 RepID=A0A914NT16_MELIC